MKWFAAEPNVKKQYKFTFALHRFEHINIVAKFRMGCHWLKSEERMVDGIFVPRSKRLCTLCDLQKREDEMHIFECPFYNDITLEFQHLLRHICHDSCQNAEMVNWSWSFSDHSFRCFMNNHHDPNFWKDLAYFLIACRQKRSLWANSATLGM